MKALPPLAGAKRNGGEFDVKTIKEIVEFADGVKPNAFTQEQKTAWISELEGRIQQEVFLMHEVETVTYRWGTDQQTQVLVEPPYDNVYLLYLAAKIDFFNGEFGKYQNSMAAFNDAMGALIRQFAYRFEPAKGYRED